MKQIKNVIKTSLIFAMAISLSACDSAKSKANTKSLEAMDTYMTIRSFGKNGELANEKAAQRIKEIENLISTTRAESEVSRLNNAGGQTLQVSDDTLRLVKFTKQGAEKSGGAFNPVLYPVTKAWGFTTKNYTVPSAAAIADLLTKTDYSKITIDEKEKTVQVPADMKFDFGAVGKGFTGDEVLSIFKSMGIKSALLDLGGNVQVLGKKVDGSPWVIGLKNPWGGEVPVAVYLDDCAMITSGGYERYFTADDGKSYIHIIDGNTGYPVENELVSATIVTKSGLYGDYLSTTLFVLGKDKAIEFWRQNKDFDFILMTEDQSLIYTKGLEGRISVFAQFNNVEVVR